MAGIAPDIAADAVIIRPVTRADVPAVIALVSEVLAEFDLVFGEGSTSDAQLAHLPDVYRDRGGAFWIAVDTRHGRDAIVGTCGVYPTEPSACGAGAQLELRKMYLAPSGRGLGIGKRLLDTAIAFCRDAGATSLVLDTVEAMHQAIGFYERAGFIRDDAQIRGARCTRGYRLPL